jgi:hypothetical protein
MFPLLPCDTTFPEAKEMEPDTPFEAESAVLMLKVPLDLAAPKPEIIETAPPVFVAD